MTVSQTTQATQSPQLDPNAPLHKQVTPFVPGQPEYLNATPRTPGHTIAKLERTPPPLPSWLTASASSDQSEHKLSSAQKALLFQEYENMLPRVLELVCSGSTLDAALDEHYREVDHGSFIRWLKKNKELYKLYVEAKEVRAETWTGQMIKHAKGEASLDDVQRSKLVVDTFKWLIECDDRQTYGKKQEINVNNKISILDALNEANSRVRAIDVDYKEVE